MLKEKKNSKMSLLIANTLNRTKSLVRKIEFLFPILNGIAFGGPNRDILFVVTPPNVNAPNSTEIEIYLPQLFALYTVTGLASIGFPTPERLALD